MLISGTVHLARIKMRDAQKISRKTGRGKITLTFIVRHLNPVFVLTVRSFLRDGPLNAQCACRGLER